MRYPGGHKETVRARIVEAAAAALRREGIDGVSIPALMKGAGLTHGGFYTHFEDRDELVSAAVEVAAAETATEVFGDEVPLDEVLDRYLSLEHLHAPMHGCVVAALGTDGPRQSAPVRASFAKAARGLLTLVERKLSPGKRARSPGDEAMRLAATMVGALVLARLVDDDDLAARLLRAARRASPTSA